MTNMDTGSSTPLHKVELEYAELHAPLFLGGKNHQMKLKSGPGLQLWYMRYDKELIVIWGKHVAIVPFHGTTNNAWPKDPQAFLEALGIPAIAPSAPSPIKASQAKVTAQVETPQSHVFAGHGAGKSR